MPWPDCAPCHSLPDGGGGNRPPSGQPNVPANSRQSGLRVPLAASSPRYLALTNIRRRSQSLPAATEDRHRPPSTPNRARTIALPCPYRPFRCCIVIPSVDLGLRGAQSTAFWRYSTSTDSWEVLPNTLMIVDDGGSLSFLDGAGYALRGDNNSDFWVFGIAPSTPLADENTPFTADTDGPVYRLRMNVAVTTVDMPTGTHRFKLQYALTSTGPWTDVGAVGSRSLSEKQCSKRYASLVECKDANYSTTKSRLL